MVGRYSRKKRGLVLQGATRVARGKYKKKWGDRTDVVGGVRASFPMEYHGRCSRWRWGALGILAVSKKGSACADAAVVVGRWCGEWGGFRLHAAGRQGPK